MRVEVGTPSVSLGGVHVDFKLGCVLFPAAAVSTNRFAIFGCPTHFCAKNPNAISRCLGYVINRTFIIGFFASVRFPACLLSQPARQSGA